MPAPAVYVIAVVGTVGAAIVFKEFIYPHIAPRIDQWKAEFQAARQRRADAERMADVPLIQRGTRRDGYQYSEDDDNESDSSFGKGNTTQPRAVMKNGLLIRRRTGHIESDDWNTGASTSTEMRSQSSDLRSRENGSLEKSIQPIRPTPGSPTASTNRMSTSGSENLNQMETGQKPVGLGLKKTIETHAFLDESVQAISYTLVSPIQTPTPTHVFHNSPSTRSPRDSSFSASISPLPEEPLPSLKTNITGTTTADNSFTSFPPLLFLSSSTVVTPSSPPQSLPPAGSQPSPYQTPPHVHTIPSLSQSYPLDDLLDYEHGLELLSPPSPLSRTDSPFEFAGLSPRPERPILLSARSGDSGEPVDSITNSTKSTAYLSFSSSPALSASSVFPTLDNGYENDSNQSDISSTFSSPFVAPTRLGDVGSGSLPPHDQAHRSYTTSPLSSPSFDYPHDQRRHRQQPERSIGSTSTRPFVPTSPTRSLESDARRPIITFNDNVHNDYAATQTLSPRDRARSPWTMMNLIATDSVATTSTSTIHPIAPPAQSRQAISQSEFDTGSELSDLDFLNMPTKDYETSLSPAGRSLGPASHSALYTGSDRASGTVGSSGGMRGSGIGDGNESDWSLAGGSE